MDLSRRLVLADNHMYVDQNFDRCADRTWKILSVLYQARHAHDELGCDVFVVVVVVVVVVVDDASWMGVSFSNLVMFAS